MFRNVTRRLPLAPTAKLFHRLSAHHVPMSLADFSQTSSAEQNSVSASQNRIIPGKKSVTIKDIDAEKLHHCAQSLLIATCLDFANHVHNVKKSLPILARELNAKGNQFTESELQTILDNLVQLGIFKVDENKSYAVSSAGVSLFAANFRRQLAAYLSLALNISTDQTRYLHFDNAMDHHFVEILQRLENEKKPIEEKTASYLKNLSKKTEEMLSKVTQPEHSKFNLQNSNTKHLVHTAHMGSTLFAAKDLCPGHLFADYYPQRNRV